MAHVEPNIIRHNLVFILRETFWLVNIHSMQALHHWLKHCGDVRYLTAARVAVRYRAANLTQFTAQIEPNSICAAVAVR